jgi:putative membrane protein
LDSKGHVRTTRSSAAWIGLIGAAIVLIALLVFILQNLTDVTVHYLGFDGKVPLGVALLLSAIAGLLLVSIPGSVRILQLRRLVKKNAERR